MSAENAIPPPGFWHGQALHFFGLAGLIAILMIVWLFLGEPLPILFWIAVLSPIIHQIFVWIAWRSELQAATVSKTIGFRSYCIVFFVLFFGRFLTLFVVAYFDGGSLGLSFTMRIGLGAVLLVPGVYALYSVHQYFGLARAAGGDHFDLRYRTMPLVKQGIFRYTDNGMYLYAFLCFWAIAVALNSSAALIIAAFSHAYIWIHFQATEKPDMNYIYRN